MKKKPCDPGPPPSTGFNRSILYVAALLVVLGGYAVHSRWILREMARLEPFEIVLIWVGDAFGVLLCAELALGGWRRRLGRELLPAPKSTRMLFLTLALVATSADATGAFVGFANDSRRFEDASSTTARVTGYRNRKQLVLLDLEYAHPARGMVRTFENCNIRDLPQDTLDRLQRGRLPVDVPLRYDPRRPLRLWMGTAQPSRPNSIYFYSLLVLLFQLILCLFSAYPVTYFVLDHLKIGLMGIQAFFLWFFFLVDLVTGMRA